MKYVVQLAIVVVLVFFLHLTFPRTSHAYLDPGTGSLIIQSLIAALLAGLVTIKVYWNRIKAFFGNRLSNRQSREKHDD